MVLGWAGKEKKQSFGVAGGVVWKKAQRSLRYQRGTEQGRGSLSSLNFERFLSFF
jgi:hypothetical protein